jgi:hypothetical protein
MSQTLDAQEQQELLKRLSTADILDLVYIYCNALRERTIQARPLEQFEIRDRILKDD